MCAELKSRFFKQSDAQLVKATQPFEGLSLDFKGPVLMPTKNYYVLTLIDEYSRFFLAFLCAAIKAKTVILCLKELFQYVVCLNQFADFRVILYHGQNFAYHFELQN